MTFTSPTSRNLKTGVRGVINQIAVNFHLPIKLVEITFKQNSGKSRYVEKD